MWSKRYASVFPATRIGGKKDKAAVHEWETSEGGGLKSISTGTGIVGFGFNFGIIDDPHKDRKSAESRASRESVVEWYRSSFYPCRQPDASILIISTRWHVFDLCGTLLAAQEEDYNSDKWDVLDLPAILDRTPIEGDPRQMGEALWPSMFPLTELAKIKATMGSYDWEAIYQQRPVPPGGGKIRREWFSDKVIDIAPEGLRWVRFYDIAVSTKEAADYTASVAAAIDDAGNVYLRDMIRGRWEWPDVHRMLITTSKVEGIPVGFEVGGQQGGFFQELQRDPELRGIALKSYKPSADKLTRALPWIARAEAGKVYLVRGKWLADFLEECQFFTGASGDQDDQIDAVSGAYIMLGGVSRKPRESGKIY